MRQRLDHVDGRRGIAAMLVVIGPGYPADDERGERPVALVAERCRETADAEERDDARPAGAESPFGNSRKREFQVRYREGERAGTAERASARFQPDSEIFDEHRPQFVGKRGGDRRRRDFLGPVSNPAPWLAMLEGKPQAATPGRLAIAILAAAAATVAWGAEDDVGWIAVNTGYFAELCLGTIRYALYLLHPAWLEMAMSPWPRFAQWPVPVVVLTPAYVAGSLLLSTIVFRMVGQPAIRAGRDLFGLMHRARSAGSAIRPSPVTDGNRS